MAAGVNVLSTGLEKLHLNVYSGSPAFLPVPGFVEMLFSHHPGVAEIPPFAPRPHLQSAYSSSAC